MLALASVGTLKWPDRSLKKQLLVLVGAARHRDPKRLRLRLFAITGRLVRGGRRLRQRFAATWPWTSQITTAIGRLQAPPSG